MKYVKASGLLILLVSVLIVLDLRIGGIPALGFFLSPQHGFWQNATPVHSPTETYTLDFPFRSKDVKNVELVFDQRDVPHIFAERWSDAAFVQGYVHAKDRLFQMDIMSRFAAGRLSELLGESLLKLDKKNRRLGIADAARNMTMEILKNKTTKALCLSYVAGVNFYLASLSKSNFPLEYKILGAEPEAWSIQKSALIFKYLSWDLSGSTADISRTRLKDYLTEEDFKSILYPIDHLFSVPTLYPDPLPATPELLVPVEANSQYFQFGAHLKKPSLSQKKLVQDAWFSSLYTKGSNAWIVGKEKSKNGTNILCNDPHLKLTLPSVWYELQMTIKNQIGVYGVSVPGIPCVMIGFNDHVAWGMTSAATDMTDYYYVHWVDREKHIYSYDSTSYEAIPKEEIYLLNDGRIVKDTIWATHLGNIIPNGGGEGTDIAIQWVGNVPSNDFLGLLRINTSTNSETFKASLTHLASPGLNLLYTTTKDIGYQLVGAFPTKWERQGDFIMPMSSAYVWENFIPQNEIPQLENPKKQFIISANQHPTGEEYHYYLGCGFASIRSQVLYTHLSQEKKFDVADMMRMQTDRLNFFAQLAIQNILVPFLDKTHLNADEQRYAKALASWDFISRKYAPERIYFDRWWHEVESNFYASILQYDSIGVAEPQEVALLELMLDPKKFEAFAARYTGEPLSIEKWVTTTFKNSVEKIKAMSPTAIQQANQATLAHLMKLAPFSASIDGGGSRFSINALEGSHGPSVRFIAVMNEKPFAYIIYPGGQSGNPGNAHYQNNLQKWADGTYHRVTIAHHISEINAIRTHIKFISNPQ